MIGVWTTKRYIREHTSLTNRLRKSIIWFFSDDHQYPMLCPSGARSKNSLFGLFCFFVARKVHELCNSFGQFVEATVFTSDPPDFKRNRSFSRNIYNRFYFAFFCCCSRQTHFGDAEDTPFNKNGRNPPPYGAINVASLSEYLRVAPQPNAAHPPRARRPTSFVSLWCTTDWRRPEGSACR